MSYNEIFESGQVLTIKPYENNFMVSITLIKRISESSACKDIWEVVLDDGEITLCNLSNLTQLASLA